MDLDDATAEQIMTNKKIKEEIASFHPYAVTLSESAQFKGMLTTHIIEEGTRKKVVAHSWNEMFRKLKAHYGIDQETLETMFPRWLKWKEQHNQNKAKTVSTNRHDFQKYVHGTPIASIPITALTPADIEDWCITTLDAYPMTRNKFNDRKIIVMGPLEYAVRIGLLEKSPWIKERIDYSRHLCSQQRRPASEQILSENELQQIADELLKDYEEFHNSVSLGLIADMDLGMRVGELSALKWEDVDLDNSKLHVCRQESESKVEDKVKADSTAGYRTLGLSERAWRIFRKLKDEWYDINPEYVFVNPSGERRKARAFIDKLRHIELDILNYPKSKGTHAFRRTLGSQIAKNIDLGTASEWLGHTDISTTYSHYVYALNEPDTVTKWLNQRN